MGGVASAIGDVGKAFDPTSSSFNPLRAGADIGTFGTAELANQATGGSIFNNNRPLGLGPLGDIGLTAAGAYFGGPLGGALAGGLTGGLGGALGGGIGGGLLSGGLGALGGLGGALGGGLGGLGGMLGGSLLGLGLSKDTSIPDVQFPSASGDIGAIQSEEQRLKGMQGQSQQDLMNMLTTGPQGEAFREKYNNLGLLDSGAFNAGLAGQFAEQNYAQNQQLQNLDVSGLSRQFGLEDVQTQYNIAKALQQARQSAAEQQGLIGSGAYLLGGGGAGMGLGGGGGGGGGGGLGGILGGLGSGLSNVFGGIGSGLSNLFGGGGGLDTSINSTTGDPMLDLYASPNPFAGAPGLPGPAPGFLQPLNMPVLPG